LNTPTPQQAGKQHGPHIIQSARLITSRSADSEEEELMSGYTLLHSAETDSRELTADSHEVCF